MTRLMFGSLVLLALSLVALPAARAEIRTEWIDYKQGDTPLQGYLAYDDSQQGKRPGVLLVHRRDGMSELTLENARMVAKLGYVVFAPDIFGKSVRPKSAPMPNRRSRWRASSRRSSRTRTRTLLFRATHGECVPSGRATGGRAALLRL